MRTLILVFLFSILALPQDRPKAVQPIDSLDTNHSEQENIKVEINDIGRIKSPTARITSDIDVLTKALVKINRGDSVFVQFLFPKLKVCYATYKEFSGYMDINQLGCQKISDYYTNLEREFELKKLQIIEEWEAKKLLEEIKSDSLKKIEDKIHLKEMTKKYGKKWGKIVANKEIMIGMTNKMVIDSWGEPDDINRTVGSWGVHEQWVYGLGQYLYFENGKLTSWQD